MINFFKTILSFIFKSFTGQQTDDLLYVKMLDIASNRIYEMLNSIAYGLSGIIMMITGFFATYFNLLSQYDRVGTITIGAVAVGGIVLIFIGFGIIYNNTKKDFTPPIKAQKAIQNQVSSPIELAIAALLQDFVKEREFVREKEKELLKIQTQQHEAVFPEEIPTH